jgi:signal transduction histidine kinase
VSAPMSTSASERMGQRSSPAIDVPATVLYVDDDRANLVAFRAMAEPQYDVVTARSGEEALQILEKRPDVAVLISDQRMPGMSGIDLCERVFASHPDTVRMLVTAYSDLSAAIAAINRGHVSRYLHKPWNADELLATLRDAVERFRLRTTVQRLQVRISETERMYALGVLTASIGHELRTPLGVVSSNVSFARRALEECRAKLGSAAAAQLADLQEIEAALVDAEDGAQRLMEVVEGISLSSRNESAKVTRQPVDLTHVVRSVLRLLRSEAQSRAQLVVELNARPTVLGTATRIGQVLLNLVLNAIQAMPQRPYDSNQVKVVLVERDGRAIIEVIDNGSGIEPAQLLRIFDPFFTTKQKGTGLGLAIARQIIEELEGQLSVESTVGVGTRFTVALPLLHRPAV